ncbi:MAG: ABC transporter permease [Caldilineaceae bacterium]|nr:ABC transporter permease [Caldilineaceae bacterium]
MSVAVSEPLSVEEKIEPIRPQRRETYYQLVWRRFRRSKPAIVGGLMVAMLLLLAIFADFFAPYPLTQTNARNAFIPPTKIHFIDSEGNFHLRPFVYEQVVEVDMRTFAPIWTENTDQRYPIQFFVKGWEYKLFGFIPMDRHLFGVEGTDIFLLGTDKLGADLWSKSCEAGRISLTMSIFGTFISVIIGAAVGVISGYYGGWFDTIVQRFVEFITAFPTLALWLALAAIVPRTWDSFRIFIIMAFIFALLSWTTLAREVRGKVLSLRETDFVMAAKEMGASDKRIMFLHVLPNTFSHIIVILTLTIPGIILAEAFLSFLGIGIQRPLISWGLLMQDAQNLRTLGETPWIMAPAAFIILAVLGFNLLGDGLRDAADPYSTT